MQVSDKSYTGRIDLIRATCPLGLGRVMPTIPRVLRILRDLSLRGKKCVRLVTLLSMTRLTPSELEKALLELEAKGLIVFSGPEVVCYVGFFGDHSTSSAEMLSAIKELGRLKRFIDYVRDVRGAIIGADAIVARRDGICFVVRIATGKLPPERLVAEARRLVRVAQRLLSEWNSIIGTRKPRLVIPVVLYRRGAQRLIDGVLATNITRFRELVVDPSPLLSDPRIRLIEAE